MTRSGRPLTKSKHVGGAIRNVSASLAQWPVAVREYPLIRIVRVDEGHVRQRCRTADNGNERQRSGHESEVSDQEEASQREQSGRWRCRLGLRGARAVSAVSWGAWLACKDEGTMKMILGGSQECRDNVLTQDA